MEFLNIIPWVACRPLLLGDVAGLDALLLPGPVCGNEVAPGLSWLKWLQKNRVGIYGMCCNAR